MRRVSSWIGAQVGCLKTSVSCVFGRRDIIGHGICCGKGQQRELQCSMSRERALTCSARSVYRLHVVGTCCGGCAATMQLRRALDGRSLGRVCLVRCPERALDGSRSISREQRQPTNVPKSPWVRTWVSVGKQRRRWWLRRVGEGRADGDTVHSSAHKVGI